MRAPKPRGRRAAREPQPGSRDFRRASSRLPSHRGAIRGAVVATARPSRSVGRHRAGERKPRVLAATAGGISVVVTLTVVALGLGSGPPNEQVPTGSPASGEALNALAEREQGLSVSRSSSRDLPSGPSKARRHAVRHAATAAASRARATRRAIASADTELWTTVELNLWSEAGPQARLLELIPARVKVLVTGRQAEGRLEVVRDGQARWVTAGYLSKQKPADPDLVVPEAGGLCDNGTTVPATVSENIIAVHATVCAAFPSISVYGTLRGGGGDHPLGRAVDIMVSGTTGWAVANLVRDNYARLGVSYVIFAQRIWSVQRSAEGWRAMSDRGSVTANHYDHVHVSTY